MRPPTTRQSRAYHARDSGTRHARGCAPAAVHSHHATMHQPPHRERRSGLRHNAVGEVAEPHARVQVRRQRDERAGAADGLDIPRHLAARVPSHVGRAGRALACVGAHQLFLHRRGCRAAHSYAGACQHTAVWVRPCSCSLLTYCLEACAALAPLWQNAWALPMFARHAAVSRRQADGRARRGGARAQGAGRAPAG